jgi:hypothetical protein
MRERLTFSYGPQFPAQSNYRSFTWPCHSGANVCSPVQRLGGPSLLLPLRRDYLVHRGAPVGLRPPLSGLRGAPLCSNRTTRPALRSHLWRFKHP